MNYSALASLLSACTGRVFSSFYLGSPLNLQNHFQLTSQLGCFFLSNVYNMDGLILAFQRCRTVWSIEKYKPLSSGECVMAIWSKWLLDACDARFIRSCNRVHNLMDALFDCRNIEELLPNHPADTVFIKQVTGRTMTRRRYGHRFHAVPKTGRQGCRQLVVLN